MRVLAFDTPEIHRLTRLELILAVAAFIAVAVVVAAFGGYLDAPGSLLLLSMATPAAPMADRLTVGWGRKREPMKTFTNVGANQTAFSKIPRYPRTILGMLLEKGGTVFTNAQLTRVEMFLGEKSIWGPISGTNLQMVERYLNGQGGNDFNGNDPFFVPMDFTFANVKEIGGEQIGGLDLSVLPDGELRVEADIAGATAPQLTGHIVWAPPQGGGDIGGLMQKLITRTYPQAPAGDFFPDVQLRGAIIARQYFRGAVMNAAVTAAQTGEGVVNTGDGVMGAIAVAALTPAGRYKFRCIEPAANAGRFLVTDPNGKSIGTLTVAVAFDIGGLSGTLADGATDFVAGDGFFVDVLPNNTNGNINLIEIKKNEDVWWQRSSRGARYEQQRYGRTPMAGLEVADFLIDNHSDGIIDTANAVALDYRLNVTAAETVTLIHQVLANPTFGKSET